MPELKRITPSKLLWLDLEMTGLNPQTDKIVEVGAIITDWNFTELGTFESGVGHEGGEVERLLDANPFFAKYPENKQHFIQLAAASEPVDVVEDNLLKFIDMQFTTDEPVLLAGNSIHMDRQFIRSTWPRLEARLHYRMLDVSAWKVVMIGKYGLEYKKHESHRALDDIRESIEELQFYLEKTAIRPQV